MLTDGRFSGGSHGFIIGHITPEAQVGGPLAVVKNGDMIEIDAEDRFINLMIADDAGIHPPVFSSAHRMCGQDDDGQG